MERSGTESKRRDPAYDPAVIDTVFLDAGGVLVQPRRSRVAAALAEVSIGIDPDGLTEAHYRGMAAIDRHGSEPEVFGDYHEAYADHLGLEGDERTRGLDVLRPLYAPGSGLWDEPLDGVLDGLRTLAERDLTMVVVSNADGSVAQLLASAGLLQVGPGPGVEVAAIVDSGIVGIAKPDPRIFEHALALVEADPARTIHVGDAYEFDVRGARAAGIRPVLVDPFDLRPDADCDRTAGISDLAARWG